MHLYHPAVRVELRCKAAQRIAGSAREVLNAPKGGFRVCGTRRHQAGQAVMQMVSAARLAPVTSAGS